MIDPFVEAVREMREAQKDWFATHKPSALIASKQAERKVDAALKELDDAAHGVKPLAQQAAMDFDEI